MWVKMSLPGEGFGVRLKIGTKRKIRRYYYLFALFDLTPGPSPKRRGELKSLIYRLLYSFLK
jgi:hypothetical protein